MVIVGYDEYNTYLYDPVKKETYPYGMNDSTDLLQKAGNVFITYIENHKVMLTGRPDEGHGVTAGWQEMLL